MNSSHELPPPYEDESAKIAKELEEARKMIEMLTSDKKRDEEKERKRELKEYAVSLEKRITMGQNIQKRVITEKPIDIFSMNSVFWEYFDKLEETYILLSKEGRLLLTDKTLYLTHFSYRWGVMGSPYMTKDELEFKPLYTFDKPLSIDELKIFNNKEFERWFFLSADTYCRDIQILKSLEHMITTIPGSYKNKGWINIGGFTGVYVNDMKGLFAGNPLYPPEKEL